jgi:hypothetical protein
MIMPPAIEDGRPAGIGERGMRSAANTPRGAPTPRIAGAMIAAAGSMSFFVAALISASIQMPVPTPHAAAVT